MMKNRLPSAKPFFNLTKFLWLFSLLVLLGMVVTGCAHLPWSMDAYIQNLERPERDEYQQPGKVIGAWNLTPGMVVADVGAGSGYFTRRFAKVVGDTGKILAIDVEQKMLDYNKQELAKLGMANRVQFILVKPEDSPLSSNSVDLVFLCNAYHHVEQGIAYWDKIKAALKPNGRVVIVDYYHDERSGPLSFSKHHLVPRERVIANMEKAGLTLTREHTFLLRQYFLEFVDVQ